VRKKQRLTRQDLQVGAQALLDKSPQLAGALQADLEGVVSDLTGRRRLDSKETQEIVAAFRANGYTGDTTYSLASQFRHPDFKDRPKDTPFPEGPTRTYFHFTSTIHLPVLLKWGISRGDVCVALNAEDRNFNAPWLTTNPDFDRQAWAEDGQGNSGATFDKRAVRLVVEIPEGDSTLRPWGEWAKELEVPDFWYKALNTIQNDAASWYIYNGRIPPTWITKVEYRDAQPVELDTWGIFDARISRP